MLRRRRHDGAQHPRIGVMLPEVYPVTLTTFNYTPAAFIVVLGGAGLWWLASARKWFTGPKVQGSEAELAAVERELEELA
jgi:hypothetical protein